jgi:hypothetical protein
MGRLSRSRRLGITPADIDTALPERVLELYREVLSHEDELGDTALLICERLLPRLNVKNRRELSEVIVRRWPDSPTAQAIAGDEEHIGELWAAMAGGGRRAVPADDRQDRSGVRTSGLRQASL